MSAPNTLWLYDSSSNLASAEDQHGRFIIINGEIIRLDEEQVAQLVCHLLSLPYEKE